MLVIAVFITMHLREAVAGDVAPGDPHAAWPLALLPVLWLIVHGTSTLSGRTLDRTGNLAAFALSDRVTSASRLLAAGAVGYSILFLGWLETVRDSIGNWVLLDELAAISPLLLFLTLTWASTYSLERRVKEAVMLRALDEGWPMHPPLGRAGFVWSHFRHEVLLSLLPLSLINAWEELVPAGARVLGLAGTGGDAPSGWWAAAEGPVTWLGVLACLVVAPALMCIAWDTVPIDTGTTHERVRRVITRYRVRVRGPLLWRTHGSMLNGAVIGLLWPFRYLLFTDALIERLSGPQFEGVVAHEVAHVRLRHVPWMGAGVVACVVLLGAAADFAARAVPEIQTAHATLPLTLATLGLTLLVFGWISRRFEWQADAFAARHLSSTLPSDSDGTAVITPEAIMAMSSALGAVADLNGLPRRRFDFRHGSVAERQRRLTDLEGRRHASLPIDRTVWRIKLATAAVLGAGVVLALAPLLLGGPAA
ncbi:MAG: hypothetical protein DYG92_04540 [Leptolyngbya sp. PLA1]|nr:hypothetical protein [Leptolyngbya sp. PLA1]